MTTIEYDPRLDSPEALLRRYNNIKESLQRSYSRSKLDSLCWLEKKYCMASGELTPKHLRYIG